MIEESLDIDLMCDDKLEAPSANYNFSPDDIEAGDTVDFIWEIK